ncbi:hypothetical protein Droror1_Dr00025505, partial [Drosera rotundifolia]
MAGRRRVGLRERSLREVELDLEVQELRRQMEALTRQVAKGGRRRAEAEEGSGDDVDEEIDYASPRSLQRPF